MTQTIQHDINPFAEGPAARVARSAATASLSSTTFTDWPMQGTQSHKLVATGTSTATVGLPNTARPAAAPGDIWSAAATVRNAAAGARTVTVALVFYDTAGATLGTSTATASASATLAADEVQVIGVASAPAPAGTASVDLQVSRAAGGGAAGADPVYFDRCTLTKTSAPIHSKDPASDPFAVWTGSPDASTQIYFEPAISATPAVDEVPAPRVIITIDDLPPGVTKLTLYCTQGGRTRKVRGAVEVPVSSSFPALDVEANGDLSYRAQLFNSAGDPLGYTPTAETTLPLAKCWVHNPLDPYGATIIDVSERTGRTLTRATDGEIFHPEGRTLGVLISGRRRGLKDVDFYFSTDDDTTAAKFEAMLGGYNDDDQQIPILCVRTPPFLDLPPTFFAAFLEMSKLPINVHMGGLLREWEATGNEVSPPAPGIVVALLTRDDIDSFFATRDDIDAAYVSRTAIDRDYTKAGATA